MKRTLTLACITAAIAGSAAAETPLSLAKPISDCSRLLEVRAEAKATARLHDYDAFDLDGDNARDFQRTQNIPEQDQAEHLTVMVNPRTGRAAALVASGPGCSFKTAFVVLTPAYATPMDAALDILRLAR